MTIIEAALEKTKSLRAQQRAAKPADAGPAVAYHSQVHRAPEPGVVPITQIQAQRVAFDPESARENRLLLGAFAAEDRGTVAAYGMLRTRILHRIRTNNWRTIGVTSAAPKDGKSLTAINLALSLAREKNSVIVLLDLDMRNPTVCRTLGVTPPVELRDYFEGRAEANSDLFMSIGVDNFIFAGNVTATQNSAELLASGHLEQLLSYIISATTNPLILIDLPPVLSPDDALVVAPRIDSMMLVASEGITPRADLKKAGEVLSGFPIAGLVLNRSSDASQKYGYGYGYGDGETPA
jgi:protein-tyrosine kinase